MIVVVLCWQQLVQTVQGEFWVRATQEGNQLATNVATVSEQQPLEIQKKRSEKRKNNSRPEITELLVRGVVCWPF